MRVPNLALFSLLVPARAGATDPVKGLRERTHDAHAYLESLPPMRRLLADDVDADEYADILARMASVVLPLDAWLFVHADDRVRLVHQRAPLLLRDLGELGRDVPDSAPVVPSMLSRLVTPSQRAGAVYVLEGSSLGGQVILRHLRARFGARAERYATYFDPNGDQRGRIWRDLLEGLRADSSLAADEAVDGALSVFEALHAVMGGSTVGVPAAQRRASGCPFARLARFLGR